MCTLCSARQRDYQADKLWIVYLLFLRIIWLGVWFLNKYAKGDLFVGLGGLYSWKDLGWDQSKWITNKIRGGCEFAVLDIVVWKVTMNCALIVLLIEASDLNTQDNWASTWQALQLSHSLLERMKKICKGWVDNMILCCFTKNKALIFSWKSAESLVYNAKTF